MGGIGESNRTGLRNGNTAMTTAPTTRFNFKHTTYYLPDSPDSLPPPSPFDSIQVVLLQFIILHSRSLVVRCNNRRVQVYYYSQVDSLSILFASTPPIHLFSVIYYRLRDGC